MFSTKYLLVLALFSGPVGWLFAAAKSLPASESPAELLIGTWVGEMDLPNGIKIHDEEKFRRDGYATGRIVTLFRDGTVKATTSYSFSWRVEDTILVSERVVRAPPREGLPDHSRDEIVRLDATRLVLRDLANNIVASYTRIR